MRSEIGKFIADRMESYDTATTADAEALAEMVSDGLVLRTNGRSTGAKWEPGNLGVSVVMVDDGEPVGAVGGDGSTPWDAAVSLAMLAGYWVPGDD